MQAYACRRYVRKIWIEAQSWMKTLNVNFFMASSPLGFAASAISSQVCCASSTRRVVYAATAFGVKCGFKTLRSCVWYWPYVVLIDLGPNNSRITHGHCPVQAQATTLTLGACSNTARLHL